MYANTKFVINAHAALSNQPALVPEEDSGPLPPQKSKMACIEYNYTHLQKNSFHPT